MKVQHLNSAAAVLICLPRLTAVYFRDREGPWAMLSSRYRYCLPRWARTPGCTPPTLSIALSLCWALVHLPCSLTVSFTPAFLSFFSLDPFLFLPRSPLSLFHRDLWSNWSSQLHKEAQIGLHLQPVYTVCFCSRVWSTKYRFYLFHRLCLMAFLLYDIREVF